jgi:hypothetical protein
LPFSIGVGAAASGRTITFSVQGSAISCCGFSGPHDADGGTNLSTNISSAGGISGIEHDSKNIFLMGVFLDDSEPVPGQEPAVLQYTEADVSSPGVLSVHSPEFSPGLRQSFFIGDGLTGDGTGSVQVFHVPDGATRLFLGFADGLNLGDPNLGTPSPAPPGFYGDNTGTLDVSYTLACP